MRRLNVQPKDHRLVSIPEHLRDGMREVHQLLQDAENDPDIAVDYDDAIQVPGLCGGRYRKGKRPFGFLYYPENGGKRDRWYLTLHPLEIEDISEVIEAAERDADAFFARNHVTGGMRQMFEVGIARLDGSLAHAGIIKISPVESLSEPLFNPTGGYASYVVPAAFLLIIQQTLLMGSATLGESGARPMPARVKPVWAGAVLAAPAYPVRCTTGDNLAIHVAVARAPGVACPACRAARSSSNPPLS